MKRPLAVKVYCGVIVALFALALVMITAPALWSRSFSAPDIILMFVPMVLVLLALFGVWLMRWWGVIALSVLVVSAEGFMIVTMPDRQSFAAVVRGALWLVPLWFIAWKHRKAFR